MKKLLTLVLALMLSVTLVACNSNENGKENEDVNVEAASMSVSTLFDEVLKDVQPGTAGCSLKSTIVAVDFLNYYKDETSKDKEVEFDEEGFFAEFQTLFDALSDDEKGTFVEAWNMVYADINSMCGEGNGAEISEKLETAGCLEKGNYPWTEGESVELFDKINNALSEFEIKEAE